MENKGGEDNKYYHDGEHHHNDYLDHPATVDLKIIITVIFSMILGALFVLGLIFFGASMKETDHLDNKRTTTSSEEDSIIKIIALEHEDESFSYTIDPTISTPAQDSQDTNDQDESAGADQESIDADDVNADSANSSSTNYSSILLNSLGDDLAPGAETENVSYRLLNKKSQVDDLIALVNRYNNSSNQVVYDIDSEFFTSGSIIAIAYEDSRLIDFAVDSLNRDGDYNVFIEASYKLDETTSRDTSTAPIAGRLILIKIGNVQPDTVDVKISDKSLEDTQ